MLQRILSTSSLLLLSSMLLLSACRKETSPTVVSKTDSTRTTTSVADTTAVVGSARELDSAARVNAPTGSVQPTASDSIPVGGARILDDNDPIARQLVESMKHPDQPRLRVDPNAGSQVKLIDPRRLAELQPQIPGYKMVGEPSNFQSTSFSRSSVLLRSIFDTTRSIRVLMIDENEHDAAPFQQQIQTLQQKGSLTSYPNGEPVTAYYVQVNGAPAAKAYNSSRKTATLSVLVSGHRLIQLREMHATSADHLVDLAKFLEVKKFEALQ